MADAVANPASSSQETLDEKEAVTGQEAPKGDEEDFEGAHVGEKLAGGDANPDIGLPDTDADTKAACNAMKGHVVIWTGTPDDPAVCILLVLHVAKASAETGRTTGALAGILLSELMYRYSVSIRVNACGPL